MRRSKKKLNKPEGANLRREASICVAGIAWYSNDQWADLRRVVSDPEELELTYEEWRVVIMRSVPDLIEMGMWLVKVPVDVAELVSWCKHRSMPIDADARAQYVLETLKQRGASSFERITTQI